MGPHSLFRQICHSLTVTHQQEQEFPPHMSAMPTPFIVCPNIKHWFKRGYLIFCQFMRKVFEAEEIIRENEGSGG